MATAGKEFNPQLKDGVVGREIVKYFENFGKVAVEAKSLGGGGKDEMNYRITFEDGEVQDYLVTFSKDFRFHILYVAPIK